MKCALIIFVLCAIRLANSEQLKKDHYNLNDSTDHVYVVKLLFENVKEVMKVTADIGTQLDAINQRINNLAANFNEVIRNESTKSGNRIDALNTRINGMEQHFNGLINDERVKTANRIAALNNNFVELERRFIIPDSGLN